MFLLVLRFAYSILPIHDWTLGHIVPQIVQNDLQVLLGSSLNLLVKQLLANGDLLLSLLKGISVFLGD